MARHDHSSVVERFAIQHALDDRTAALLGRLVALLTPPGLSAEDEDAVYRTLLQAVERAESAAK